MNRKPVSLTPKLSNFGAAIAWLLDRDVSASRLAGIFATTPENIRVIAFRMRHALPDNRADLERLDAEVSSELKARLGIRSGRDEVVGTPARRRKLQVLADEIETIRKQHTDRYEFLKGAKALRQFAALIGYAGEARRIALAAQLHQHIAWFLVHSGHSASALQESCIARDLWRAAYRESGAREYAAGFVQAALIASHALLLARRPQEAWSILDVVRDAAQSVGAPVGSDHYRQRGVALLQLREDRRAAQQFEKSAQMMEKLEEASVPEQLLLTGARHRSLLDLNCDQSQDVWTAARNAFGERSLEASIAMHWAAASSLSSDSSSMIAQAVAALSHKPEPAAQFGHQVTIRKLLVIMPELGFDARLRRAWVRRALYENAFSRR